MIKKGFSKTIRAQSCLMVFRRSGPNDLKRARLLSFAVQRMDSKMRKHCSIGMKLLRRPTVFLFGFVSLAFVFPTATFAETTIGAHLWRLQDCLSRIQNQS